jgi:Mg-chelatase subunit ChlI
LEEGLSLFGLDVHKLKEHIGTSRPKYVDLIDEFTSLTQLYSRDIERIASCYVKADLVPKKRKRDESPAKESNKRQKTDSAELPSVKGSQEKKSTASPAKKTASTNTPAKGKDKAKEAEKKKKKESSSSESSSEEEEPAVKKTNTNAKHSNNNKKSESVEVEESSSSESADFD